jgi:hypothetical protein
METMTTKSTGNMKLIETHIIKNNAIQNNEANNITFN